jgi:hypothetical protein
VRAFAASQSTGADASPSGMVASALASVLEVTALAAVPAQAETEASGLLRELRAFAEALA